MKLQTFCALCAYTLVFACIGYSTMDIVGRSLDNGGLLVGVAVIGLLTLIGVGYWLASLLDAATYPKLPKWVNFAVLVASMAVVAYTAITLYVAGQIVFPSLLAVLVTAGGFYLFYWARKKRRVA